MRVIFDYFMKERLMRIGFTENEAIIFGALVSSGELAASELSKKVSIDRSVTYNILDNLILKGFVSYILREGKKKFFVQNPESLSNSFIEKMNIASELAKEIREKQKNTNHPLVLSVHEGKDALKVLDTEWLNAKKIYALNVIGKADSLIPYHMAQIRHSAPKNTEAKVIVSSEEGKKAMELYGLKPKVMPKKYWNECPIVIHNDVVLISVFEDEKPIAVRIQNKTIADAFKKDFELLWGLMK